MLRTIHISILVLAAALILSVGPTAANAADCDLQSPTADQYCPPSTIIEEGGNDPGGALPFTGYDAGLAALAAAVLVGAGIGLSRAAKADRAS